MPPQTGGPAEPSHVRSEGGERRILAGKVSAREGVGGWGGGAEEGSGTDHCNSASVYAVNVVSGYDVAAAKSASSFFVIFCERFFFFFEERDMERGAIILRTVAKWSCLSFILLLLYRRPFRTQCGCLVTNYIS